MRKIWLSKTDWDEPLLSHCLIEWENLQKDIAMVDQIHIPRWVQRTDACHIKIHAFSDASEYAYGAAGYIRIQSSKVTLSLLLAKTRLAPTNAVSIPRLELCGAVLMAEIVAYVAKWFNINRSNIFLRTDSMVVLSWLQQPACVWTTFVGNRVSTITDLVGTTNWQHVRSKENPADLASRGIALEDLKDNKLWWNGPHWLEEESFTYSTFKTSVPETTEERKLLVVCSTITNFKNEFVERFSNYSRML